MMNSPSGVLLRRALVSLALIGCRGGTSVPRHTSIDHSVPSEGEGLVFRQYPLSVSVCLNVCDRIYRLCKGMTPECEAFDRLAVNRRSPRDSDVGGSQASAGSSLQLFERAHVCVTTCGNPGRLCDRRCFDRVLDGGLPPQR